MKPVDVKRNTYINCGKEINNKNPKFKIDDNVRISKHKNIFAKGYVPNWSEEIFISHLNEKKIVGTFYEKELQIKKKKSKRV